MKALSRYVMAVLAVFALALAVSACAKKEDKTAAPQGGAITWMGYTEGMKKAKETGKPVLVDFYTTWCKYCVMMDDTTFKDPGVAEILGSDFIAIKVNAEGTGTVMEAGKTMTESELAAVYKVSGYPTLWVFDGTGKSIGALPGYQSAEELKPALTYLSSGAYANGTSYEDYLGSLKKK